MPSVTAGKLSKVSFDRAISPRRCLFSLMQTQGFFQNYSIINHLSPPPTPPKKKAVSRHTCPRFLP